MSKYSCNLVKDLLPLYAENLCSDESREIVAEHIAQCSDCKDELQKLNTGITVQADKDIAAIKRVKRRIRFEKIGIVAAITVAVLMFVWFALLFMTNTYVNMDYEKYNLGGNVYVEESENGDIWLVKENAATRADTVFPTIRDGEGHHMGYDDDFNRETKEAFGVTLQIMRINDLFCGYMVYLPERSRLFNKYEKPDMQQVFYYDADNKTEYVLWERS